MDSTVTGIRERRVGVDRLAPLSNRLQVQKPILTNWRLRPSRNRVRETPVTRSTTRTGRRSTFGGIVIRMVEGRRETVVPSCRTQTGYARRILYELSLDGSSTLPTSTIGGTALRLARG